MGCCRWGLPGCPSPFTTWLNYVFDLCLHIFQLYPLEELYGTNLNLFLERHPNAPHPIRPVPPSNERARCGKQRTNIITFYLSFFHTKIGAQEGATA